MANPTKVKFFLFYFCGFFTTFFLFAPTFLQNLPKIFNFFTTFSQKPRYFLFFCSYNLTDF